MVTTKKTATQKPTAAASKPKKGAKAQKAPVKRGISDELIPIEEETWLLQPIAVTMMRHDYSLIQVRIRSIYCREFTGYFAWHLKQQAKSTVRPL